MRNLVPLMQLFASTKEIEGRTKVQKIVYILQTMGYPFNETYRYHLHGPYASSLTDRISRLVYLEMLHEASEDAGGVKRFRYTATPDLNKLLEEFKPALLESLQSARFRKIAVELNEQNSSLLEVVATALYLIQEGKYDDDLDAELQRRKPHLQKQIPAALEYLRELKRRGWLVVN